MEHINGLVQILGVLGVGTIGAAIVVAVSSRKRIGAETTEKTVTAAGEQIDNMREEVKEARAEVKQTRRERIIWELRQRGWWTRADAHAPWDRQVMKLLDENGITYPPPPPLYPPDSE